MYCIYIYSNEGLTFIKYIFICMYLYVCVVAIYICHFRFLLYGHDSTYHPQLFLEIITINWPHVLLHMTSSLVYIYLYLGFTSLLETLSTCTCCWKSAWEENCGPYSETGKYVGSTLGMKCSAEIAMKSKLTTI